MISNIILIGRAEQKVKISHLCDCDKAGIARFNVRSKPDLGIVLVTAFADFEASKSKFAGFYRTANLSVKFAEFNGALTHEPAFSVRTSTEDSGTRNFLPPHLLSRIRLSRWPVLPVGVCAWP